jgi:hypothetical protein
MQQQQLLVMRFGDALPDQASSCWLQLTISNCFVAVQQ